VDSSKPPTRSWPKLSIYSAETFKPLWDIVCCWRYFYVTDGWKVPSFIDSGDHIVSKTYMTRVEGENTRLRHYLARHIENVMLFQARGYAEVFSSIITSLLEVLGNTRIELNHPHLCTPMK